MVQMLRVSVEDIKQALLRISGVAHKTQANLSRSTSEWLGTQVFLKLENEQTTGSFKIRGALNKISQLSAEERRQGVIAASAGNHAQGVAYSARAAGVSSVVVMPATSPIIKIQATQGYGARVVLFGASFDEAYERSREIQKDEGRVFVHPYEDAQVIAGQGTIGLELLEQIPDLDSVVVPIGGGGLISGIATAVKALRPGCRVYGVVTEKTPGMKQLFEHRKVELTPGPISIADGISVKRPSETMYKSFIEPLVDDIVAVSDEEISAAIVFLLERAKTVAEGSGAAALAGAAKAGWDLGRKSAVLVCGGNIDLNLISRIIEKGLKKAGRLIRFRVSVDDRPGQLLRLVEAISRQNANILEVWHDRLDRRLALSETFIEILVETRGREHIDSIRKSLVEAGAKSIEQE
jgi:threonine dehydratase